MTALDSADLAGQSRKLAAARASIAASALLAVAKLAAGLWSGSLALLSEAGHAFVDTGATVLTFYAVREAEKPADAEHHYGHGKFEALAALVETGLLFGLALLVVGEAIRRLMEPDVQIEAGWPVYAVLGVSIGVDFIRSRQLGAIAQEEHSDALAADALHFASDLVSSVLALAGVAATHFGFLKGDALASFGVAVFIAIAGYRLGKRTISTLLDVAPGDLTPQIREAISEVPGVIALDDLRLRSVGPEVIGEAVIGVSRSLRMEQAAHIKERIMLVAARRHVVAHHVLAQQIGERLSIGLDIELDGAMPIGRAHAIATDFETAIRDEFGADVEIETHIEPLAPHVLIGRDAPGAIGAGGRRRRSSAAYPRSAIFPTFTTCASARALAASWSIIIARSIRASPSRRCTPPSICWSGACERSVPKSSASSAMRSRKTIDRRRPAPGRRSQRRRSGLEMSP